jgi:hypothetical protein
MWASVPVLHTRHHLTRALPLLVVGACACADRSHDTQAPLDAEPIHDVEVELSGWVPTVATVRWRTDAPSSGRVHFQTDGEPELITPATTEGTEHQALLLGMLPDRVYRARIVAEVEGVERVVDDLELETGLFAPDLPSVQHSLLAQETPAEGYIILPMMPESLNGCWSRILDGQGRTVWAAPVPCNSHRTRLAPDGSGLLISSEVDLGTKPGCETPLTLLHMAWDGTLLSETDVVGGHHDITVLGDGAWAALGFDPRDLVVEGEEYPVMGDSIVEVDPSGEARVVWSLLDDRPPVADELVRRPSMYGYLDWSHCNYLNYVPAEDAYYLTCRALEAIYKVDRASGQLAWSLQLRGGDFSHDEERDLLGAPHSVELVDEGLLVFNQHWSGCSEATVIHLDHEDRAAARVWSYEHASCGSVGYLGNAWPLEGGDVLVVFSELGEAYGVSPSGEEQWLIQSEFGWMFSYGVQLDSLYVEVES